MLKSIRIATAVAALALAGAAAYLSLSPPEVRTTLQIGGTFELASSNGGVVRSADLAGKPYGVFFGFTHCPEVCPTTLFEMSEAMKAAGDAGKDFRLFFITVDPERDTAEKLKDYLSNFDPRIEALVPTMAQLPQIASSFRAMYEKVPTSDGEYTMNHTATVFLFGRDSKFTSSISFGEARETRDAKLAALLSAK